MVKNLFFVLQLKKNNHFTAMAVAVPKSQNLYHYFDDYNHDDGQTVEVVHYVDTWKHAIELEQVWNKGFELNGNGWTKEDYA